MVYFGVQDGTKGNRLYDPRDMKLQVSHGAMFDEKEAWRTMKIELVNRKEQDMETHLLATRSYNNRFEMDL
nr:retrotransposon protein, putative, unclassified [Tanacetum cinerariifolium]